MVPPPQDAYVSSASASAAIFAPHPSGADLTRRFSPPPPQSPPPLPPVLVPAPEDGIDTAAAAETASCNAAVYRRKTGEMSNVGV